MLHLTDQQWGSIRRLIFSPDDRERVVNHYGHIVDSETPVTGVIHQGRPEHLIEEIVYHQVADLTCENCPARILESVLGDHDNCMECETFNHTILLGDWMQDNDRKWLPNKLGKSRYAAIARGFNVQVVWSYWVRRAALCSPCYPGQADLDTRGTFLAYDVPPEMYGNRGPEPQY